MSILDIDDIKNSSDERKSEIILELLKRDHELLEIIKMSDEKKDKQMALLNEQTAILNEKLNHLKNMNDAVNERINILQKRVRVLESDEVKKVYTCMVEGEIK